MGFIYTPQQLAGSLKYGAGVRLGNWREDSSIDEMRLQDFVAARDKGDLALLRQKGELGPQSAAVALSPAPADGVMKLGDTVQLKSELNGSTVAVSLGQPLPEENSFMVFGANAGRPVARSAVSFTSFDGAADGSPLTYGAKLVVNFSALELGGAKAVLASCPSSRTVLSTQLVNKQDVYMLRLDEGQKIPYDAAWCAPNPSRNAEHAQLTPPAAAAC